MLDGGNGGAIYSLNDSNLILKNSEFKGNNSTDGGAICVDGNFSDIERQKCDIDNCNFLQNYSERGGAINNDLNLTISDCNFKDNTLKIIYNDYGDSSEVSDLHGASILNGKTGKVILNNSNFKGSRQDIIRNEGTISLKKCQFEDNHEINGFKVSIHENEKDDWWDGIKFIK